MTDDVTKLLTAAARVLRDYERGETMTEKSDAAFIRWQCAPALAAAVLVFLDNVGVWDAFVRRGEIRAAAAMLPGGDDGAIGPAQGEGLAN